MHQQHEPGQLVGRVRPQIGVELGRGVEARLVGLHDPEQTVAVEIAIGSQPVVLARRSRALGAGSPTAIRHAQASAGGWMLAVIVASSARHVVRVAPAARSAACSRRSCGR